jgi:hypothetical protein
MGASDVAGDTQSQAAAAGTPAARRLDAVERLEHPLQFVLGYPRPCVQHAQRLVFARLDDVAPTFMSTRSMAKRHSSTAC